MEQTWRVCVCFHSSACYCYTVIHVPVHDLAHARWDIRVRFVRLTFVLFVFVRTVVVLGVVLLLNVVGCCYLFLFQIFYLCFLYIATPFLFVVFYSLLLVLLFAFKPTFVVTFVFCVYTTPVVFCFSITCDNTLLSHLIRCVCVILCITFLCFPRYPTARLNKYAFWLGNATPSFAHPHLVPVLNVCVYWTKEVDAF